MTGSESVPVSGDIDKETTRTVQDDQTRTESAHEGLVGGGRDAARGESATVDERLIGGV